MGFNRRDVTVIHGDHQIRGLKPTVTIEASRCDADWFESRARMEAPSDIAKSKVA